MIFFSKKKKQKKELEEILTNYQLPTFSTVVLKVLNMLRNPESRMNEIALELVQDPSLVVSIFKMVNSSTFGLVNKVNDLSQAVMLLGRGRVESIVLTHAVSSSIPKVKEKWFDMGKFWETAATRAILAKQFAKILHPDTAINSFTSAMLQDIGIPILVDTKGEQYSKIYTDILAASEPNIIQLEQATFSLDHQELGLEIAERWTLPEYLLNSIGFHHDSTKVDPALFLVSNLELIDVEQQRELLISLSSDKYGISPEMTTEIIEIAKKEASSIKLA